MGGFGKTGSCQIPRIRLIPVWLRFVSDFTMTPKLILRPSDGSTAEFVLNESSFYIGRSSGNDIVLPDGAASGHDAVLKLNETGNFTITDLESTNLPGNLLFQVICCYGA